MLDHKNILFIKRLILIPIFTIYAQIVHASGDLCQSSELYQKIKELPSKGAVLRLLYPKGSLANIQAGAKEFTKNTQVRVNLIETSLDDINTQILLSTFKGNSNFDLALPATFGIPELVDGGALANLTQYAKKYEPESHRQGYLYALGDTFNGQFYGYQTDGDVYMMFYNKKLLDDPVEQKNYKKQYGHTLSVPTTWTELDQQMQFFTRPQRGAYGGCLFRTKAYMVWEWWARFSATGSYPFDDEMHPNIDNQHGVAALTNLVAASKYQHPKATSNGLFENWKTYAQGSCYANIGWGGTQKYLNKISSAMRDNLYYSPTPAVAYFNWGWNYVVSRFSEHKELAYLFSLYMTCPQTSTQAVRNVNGFFDPFREEHYNDDFIKQSYNSEFLDAHKRAMKSAIPDLYLKGQAQYLNSLREAIELANNGVVTPKQALQFAAKQWEKITDEIGRDKQIESWRYLKSQYPKDFNHR